MSWRAALPEPEEEAIEGGFVPLGDVIDMEIVRPPWEGWTAIGTRVGRVWFWASLIVGLALRCAAHLCGWATWSALRGGWALIRRRSA